MGKNTGVRTDDHMYEKTMHFNIHIITLWHCTYVWSGSHIAYSLQVVTKKMKPLNTFKTERIGHTGNGKAEQQNGDNDKM